VLLDLGLPDSDGLEALVAVSAHAPSVPVVVLTSRSDESFARRALQEGAQDYVIKGDADPALLVKCIRYAIERKRAKESLRESERRYRLMFESSPEPMWVVDFELMRFLAVNDAAVQVYGFSREEFIGKSVAEIYGGDRSQVERSAAAATDSSHTMTTVH